MSQVALNSDVIGTTVDIPDANLESALRSKLDISSDPFTDSDLARVTHLSVIHAEIATLEGLEYCRNLVHLSLIGAKVKDIGPIAKLKNLKWLYLAKNRISDVSALKELENLYELDLKENQIHDIYPLVNNPGIGQGDVISVKSNPLNEVSIKNYIHGLKARGVHLSMD